MSYSFRVWGDSKDEVKKKVAEAFDAVVPGQPQHAAEKEATIALANAFVDLLTAEPGQGEHFSVGMSGTLGLRGPNSDEIFNVSADISASIRQQAPAA